MTNTIIRSLSLAFLVGLSSSPAEAVGGFILNKADWDSLSAERKHGFVMGSIDRMLIPSTEAPGLNSYIVDLDACMLELKLNSTLLIEIIDLEYQDVSNWRFSPTIILQLGLREACLAQINGYRAQRNEPPLSPMSEIE